MTGKLGQRGGHAQEQLVLWQVLWMAPSSDRTSVYVNGKEMYLTVNVMTLFPLANLWITGTPSKVTI